MTDRAGRETVDVENVNCCALCHLPEDGHGDRLGWGHLADDRKHFVPPSAELIERRRSRHYRDDLPLAGPATHLVRTTCRCGATAVATPEQAPHARCSGHIRLDIDEKGTSAL